MATVYLARDLETGSAVALKVLRPELAPILGPERFAREVRIVSSLQHPNILPVLRAGQTEDGLPFYVTPYIEGGSLAKLLQREGQLPIPRALHIARQIAAALQAAHQRGFVHRDIKPSNILLADSRAILADFGIARAMDVVTAEKLTESGIAVGTPAYMSPEQASCGIIDGRSDIYSLACVLFEMLTGTPPFSGSSAQSLQARHAIDPPPRIRTVRPTVSPELEQVIDTALEKVPADRYPTAQAFAAALEGHARLFHSRAFRTRRVLGAGVLVLAGIGLWAFGLGRPEPLESNRVVVFPLAQRSADDGRSGVGEEVALLLGSALEHSEPLKWIDGWTWLDSAQRTDADLIDGRTARDIARGRRARFYIDGAVMGSADSGTVILRLNDALGDSLVAQATSSGGGGRTVAQAGLAAVSQLLPRLLAPGREVDFAPLSDRRPAAIAHWLQGEREYRQSQYVRALEYYRKAVAEDSALALAAVNGAQAADWMGEDEDAKNFLAAALAHETNLPRKYAHLARGFHFFLQGAADSAVARYRLALALDPGWAAGWAALGDVYYHLLPDASPLDSLAHAAFTTARRADPEFLPPLFHLAEIAATRGDPVEARRLTAEFRRFNPDPTWVTQLELMTSCRSTGPGGVAWEKETAAHPDEVFYLAQALATGGAHWGCSEAAVRQVLGSDSTAANYQRAALLMLQSMLVAQRRFGEAKDLIDGAIRQGVTDARALYVVDAVAGAPFETQARAALDALGDGNRTLQAPKLWFRGTWYAHAGDEARLAEVVDQLHRRVRSSEDPADSLLAGSMAARLDLVRGDTSQAIARFSALRPVAGRTYITWGLWQSLAAERIQLADLLLARGEAARAFAVASGFDHFEPIAYVLYWPRSLAVRARAAAMMGRGDLEGHFTARLRAIGRDDLLHPVARGNSSQPRRQP